MLDAQYLFTFIIIALAVYEFALLFVTTFGPFDVFEKIRQHETKGSAKNKPASKKSPVITSWQDDEAGQTGPMDLF